MAGQCHGNGAGQRLGWDFRAWVSLAQWTHGWVGQGCGGLETSPAAASLVQGLMAPVGETWGPGL